MNYLMIGHICLFSHEFFNSCFTESWWWRSKFWDGQFRTVIRDDLCGLKVFFGKTAWMDPQSYTLHHDVPKDFQAKKRGIQLRNVTKRFSDTPKYPKLSLIIFEYLPIRYLWFLCIYPKCHIGSWYWYSHTILMMMTFHTLPRSILALSTKAQVTSFTLSRPNYLSVSGGTDSPNIAN